MCRRIAQFLLVALACICVLAIFVPWQRLFWLSDEQAVRCIAARMLLLPVFVLCVLGATWAARTGRSGHSTQSRTRGAFTRTH